MTAFPALTQEALEALLRDGETVSVLLRHTMTILLAETIGEFGK